jgi:hypothetical protein
MKTLKQEYLEMFWKNSPQFYNDRLHRVLTRRWKLQATIDEYASDGLIFLVESGRDCDGVQYSGHVHSCEATPVALHALEDSISDWADGPFSLSFIHKHEVKDIEYVSRDLTLEAFEDGHQHVLYV